MSCGLEMEKLKDFDKQLDEQAANLEVAKEYVKEEQIDVFNDKELLELK